MVESRLNLLRAVLALIVSCVVHTTFVITLVHEPTQQPATLPPDVWAGVTSTSATDQELFEISDNTVSTTSGEQEAKGSRAQETSANEPPRAVAPEVLATTESTPTQPVASVVVAANPSHSAAPRTSSTPRPTSSQSSASSAFAPIASSAPSAPGTSIAPRARAATSAAATTAAASASSASTTGGSPSFGTDAEAAKRDIGRAFTRALKDAGHGDRSWADLPPSHVASIEVVIHVDVDGKIAGFETKTTSPLPQLVEIVRRTVAMLKFGVFSIREGSISAGVQRMQLTSKTSDVDASSVAGGTTAMSFEYANGAGQARFTQPSGRHVEVSVRLLNATK